jgi:hypothetical protein
MALMTSSNFRQDASTGLSGKSGEGEVSDGVRVPSTARLTRPRCNVRHLRERRPAAFRSYKDLGKGNDNGRNTDSGGLQRIRADVSGEK